MEDEDQFDQKTGHHGWTGKALIVCTVTGGYYQRDESMKYQMRRS